MSKLRRYEPFLAWDGHEVESKYASMREHENGAWTDYFKALSIELERDALRSVLIALLREHDSAPDTQGSDAWDAARKLLEGK